jgi:hypothetical protein
MFLVPLLAAPAVMVAATVAERRFGAAAAGAVGAAPVALAVVILSVDSGAATIAFSAAAHVVAQVAFAAAFALAVAQRGGWVGALAGVVAFGGVSLAVELMPVELAIAAAVGALVAVPGRRPEHRVDAPGGPPTPGATVIGAAATIALVGSALTAAELAGPAAAGTVGAFPAVSAVLALVIARSRGRRSAANALKALAGGLRGYLAFCLAVATAAPVFGVGPAVALGLAVCAAQSLLPRNSVRPGGLGSSANPRLV